MSVASEISRIQADRSAIRAKLVELGMAQNTDGLDELAATSVTIPAGYVSGGTVSLTGDIEEALAAI